MLLVGGVDAAMVRMRQGKVRVAMEMVRRVMASTEVHRGGLSRCL